jgi:phage FluMu protein Com
MVDIKCRIIEKPTRPVINQTTTKVAYFNGNGPDSYLCGNCNFILAKNVTLDQIQMKFRTPDGLGLVVTCPECKSYNELGPDFG